MWVEPPLVEQIFIIDSQRCEKHLKCLEVPSDKFNSRCRQEQEWAVESAPTLVNVPHCIALLTTLQCTAQHTAVHCSMLLNADQKQKPYNCNPCRQIQFDAGVV